MDVTAVIAVVGGIALLVGILGGGFEAERIKVPTIPKYPRLISGIVGVILIITSVWLSLYPSQQPSNNIEHLSTSTPPVFDTASLPTNTTPLVISAVNPDQVVFSLKEAVENSFYKLGNANFILGKDKTLVVYGTFSEGIYLKDKMPKNFRAVVNFQIGDPESHFILGLSDGVNWRPNYHFVLRPNYIDLKKQVKGSQNWDYYLQTVNIDSSQHNGTFEVEFERSDGNIKIFVNGETAILFGNEPEEINKYNYLYLTGGFQGQPYIVQTLTIENLDK